MKNLKLNWMCGHVTTTRAFCSTWNILINHAHGNLCPSCEIDYDVNHSKDNELTDEDIATMAAQQA
jgi:hypothetical protein